MRPDRGWDAGSQPGLLATADGQVFRGRAVGGDGVAVGEVVFNTSMTGYQEVLTDPSYIGQLVVMTMPHIGNYGVADRDQQAPRPGAAGLVVRSLSRRASNWQAEGSLADYLRANRVVALTDIDTRRLTRHIREKGAMPAAIGAGVDESEMIALAASAPVMEGRDLASAAGTTAPYLVRAGAGRLGLVVAIDLGMKRAITEQLAARGFDVQVVPASATAEEVLSYKPDGVFVSNGPGDPEPLAGPVATLRDLLGKAPVFGICLGHQVMGLALGARTFKLPFGHHGGNHPVRRLTDGGVEITAQNHGFAVDLWYLAGSRAPEPTGLAGPQLLPVRVDSRFGSVRPTHQNLNDGTLEGLACDEVPAFSVQYHPEAAPGPHDAQHLFDRFVDLIDRGT